ncbi:hypothetical protein ACPOL_1516 [Acidisarcina polymorpha]|uniref:Uncharacterized protein n=1 Tax=Acidisarcina polymorpha TaxID=2211140 RepID=A0A2Z5FVT0_9BACT|nr:hypothetical protein ACPOL_1516 [Acidisarcina polymorpha]
MRPGSGAGIVARGGRRVESLPAAILDEVLAITAALFH